VKTLLLDRTQWDLVLDAAGNIALASEPYSQAQDVASAVKLFAGELYYNTANGVPHWGQILGLNPPITQVKALIVDAALTVPGVTAAKVYVSSLTSRTVSGQIHISDAAGAVQLVNF
jgi:hypothetical protein